jgi:hypothetical protein
VAVSLPDRGDDDLRRGRSPAASHATTLAGREGIAVAAYDPSQGTLDELIFDPKTYLYIGDSQIALNGTHMPKGTVNGNAVLQIAVVDKAGQLP